MSIPQICPSCGNHLSTAHAPDCCYGTPEYAHLGWPNTLPESAALSPWSNGISMEEIAAWDRRLAGDLTALQRMLEFLRDEPEELVAQEVSDKGKILCRLNAKANELRKEAAGIHLVEARAKRTFAADILDSIISELSE